MQLVDDTISWRKKGYEEIRKTRKLNIMTIQTCASNRPSELLDVSTSSAWELSTLPTNGNHVCGENKKKML